MYKNPIAYKQFLLNYIELLDDLLEEITSQKHLDAKQLAELRTAERSFNFLLNMFGNSTDWRVADHFDTKDWNELKKWRDRLASEISSIIEDDPKLEKRYGAFCESLKDLRRLSSLL